MFSKSLFFALTALALSALSVHGAPAPECPAASTVTLPQATVTVTAGASTTSAPSASKGNNLSDNNSSSSNNNSGSSSSSNNIGNFGHCSTPEIQFGLLLSGNKEQAFAPIDTKSFNHGAAQQIETIAAFICQELTSSCKADKTAQATCSTASQAAAKGSFGGGQADTFNGHFGKQTNYGGKSTGSQSTSSKASSSTSSTSAFTTTSGLSTSTASAATSTATNNALGNSTSSNSTGSNSTGSNNDASSNSTSSSNSTDPQSSLTLDPAVISTGFEQDGQQTPTAGQVASLTSDNNFINFCLTTNQPLTNGQQITSGSCNTAPMGSIPSTANMPSSKFVYPPNFGTIKANTAFTIQMAVSGFETGNFVNAETNYFAAPQQLNAAGQIIGHTHVVIELLTSLQQTTPTNPKVFAFFKGLNSAAVDGIVSADVTDGLPQGVYRIASINTAANHQPVLGPVAQHGSFDDQGFFTVTASGVAASNSTTSDSTTSNSTTSDSTSTASDATSTASNATSSGAPPASSSAASNSTTSASAVSSAAAVTATPAATPAGTKTAVSLNPAAATPAGGAQSSSSSIQSPSASAKLSSTSAKSSSASAKSSSTSAKASPSPAAAAAVPAKEGKQ